MSETFETAARVLALLRDGQWHSARQLARGTAGPLGQIGVAVKDAMRRLAADGHQFNWRGAGFLAEYRLRLRTHPTR